VSPKEVHPPKGRRYKGKNKVYSSVARQWNVLCQAKPGPMYTCYVELAANLSHPVIWSAIIN
jgi:hypothetical protein